METFVLSPEILAAIAGAVLSLLFSYVPGLNSTFAKLVPETKQLIMAGLLLAVSAVIFGLNCADIIQAGVSCDRQGVIQMVWIFLTAIMANQGVYRLTPQTATVKAIKDSR